MCVCVSVWSLDGSLGGMFQHLAGLCLRGPEFNVYLPAIQLVSADVCYQLAADLFLRDSSLTLEQTSRCLIHTPKTHRHT